MQNSQRKRRAVLYADDAAAVAESGAVNDSQQHAQSAFWAVDLGSDYLLPDDLDTLLDGFDLEGAAGAFEVAPGPFIQPAEPATEAHNEDAHSRENSGSGPTDTLHSALQSAESGLEQPPDLGTEIQLRCIDDTHPPDCARCTPAPAAELEGGYELVGDPGKKNGEKRLRHLLTRTPEWKSSEERERLADMCSRETALGPLAAALHAKSCSALRKGHLLFMVRAWGYKSDLWVPRGSRGKTAAAAAVHGTMNAHAVVPAAASATQRQQQLVRHPGVSVQQQHTTLSTTEIFRTTPASISSMVETERLTEYVNTRLKPLALEAARCNVGSAASEAAWLYGGSHITEAATNEVRKVVDLTKTFSDQWRLQKKCIGDRLESLVDMHEEAMTPAYLTCMGKESPTEKLIFEILQYIQQAASFNSSIPKQRGEALTAAEQAWVQELAKGQKIAMELLARILAIIAEARLATLQLCLSAFGQLLDVLTMWTTASSASFAQREAWMRSYMSVHGAGTGSLLIFKVSESAIAQIAGFSQQQQQKSAQCAGALALETEARRLAAF